MSYIQSLSSFQLYLRGSPHFNCMWALLQFLEGFTFFGGGKILFLYYILTHFCIWMWTKHFYFLAVVLTSLLEYSLLFPVKLQPPVDHAEWDCPSELSYLSSLTGWLQASWAQVEQRGAGTTQGSGPLPWGAFYISRSPSLEVTSFRWFSHKSCISLTRILLLLRRPRQVPGSSPHQSYSISM